MQYEYTTRDTVTAVRIQREIRCNERYGAVQITSRVQSNTMKYGKAQDDFVKHIRASIDANPDHFFDDKDWRNLTIKGGRHVGLTNRKLEAASFYVKPVAAWVPHLLIPGHVPSCPKCEQARSG